jgi:hypothetical protein
VVINVHTDLVATLALVSLRRNAPDVPLRLVNCEPSPTSRDYFADLAIKFDFEVVEENIGPHGEALDRLFRAESADLVLLLDSDAEVLDPDLVPKCGAFFENDQVFGAGFVHGPAWLGEAQGRPDGGGYYQERAWLPFAIFRTEMVQEALQAGHSFAHFIVYNDVAASPRLSSLLAGRFPNLNHHSLHFARLPELFRTRWQSRPFKNLAWLRRDYYGQRPNYVYYDTGASVYQYCKYQRGWIFAGIDSTLHEPYVAHYHGVTRHTLSGELNATALASVSDTVVRRLGEYGLQESDLAAVAVQ